MHIFIHRLRKLELLTLRYPANIDLLSLRLFALEDKPTVRFWVEAVVHVARTPWKSSERSLLDDGEGFDEVDGSEELFPAGEVELHEAALTFVTVAYEEVVLSPQVICVLGETSHLKEEKVRNFEEITFPLMRNANSIGSDLRAI